MAINNVKFKALPLVPPAEPQPAGAAPSIAEAEEMLKKLKAALDQIDYAEKYDQYLSVGEKAQLEKYRALLMADVEALNYFLQTGDWLGPVLPAGATDAQQFFDINSVGTGWYMCDQNKNILQVNSPKDTESGDEGLCEDGTYAGTINIEKTAMTDANGNIIPTMLWFVMGPGDDGSMAGIEGKTVKEDLIITITYKEDGHKESYVIKGGATRPDIQIGVNALKADDGVFMNFANMLTINPKTGEKRGVYIIGSKFGDRITGTYGIDNINAAGGNDIIDSLGESDIVSGYANSAVQSEYSADTLGTDGDDTFYDVFGTDIIDGGPGAKDRAWVGSTEEIAGQTWNVEFEEELFAESGTATKNKITGWLSGTAGWTTTPTYDATKGEYWIDKIDNQPDNNTIVLDLLGQGYMISATRDEADIIYTFVKPGSMGSTPEYIKLRVKNYFNQTNTKTTIKNGFIDMSSDDVNVGTNPVTLIGTDNDGDILLAPLTFFDEYGMTASEIGSGNMSQEEIESKLAVWQDEDALDSIWKHIDESDPKSVGKIVDGEIQINWVDVDMDLWKDDIFSIPTEFGAIAFSQYDSTAEEAIITVISNKGTTNTRLVIRIKGIDDLAKYQALDIRLNMNKSSVHDLGDIKAGDYLAPGVVMNGGAGLDFMAGSEWGSSGQDDSNDSMIKVSYPGSVTDHEPVGTSDVMTAETLSDAIDAVGGEDGFIMLEDLLEKVNTLAEGNDKKSLLDDIADKAKDLIEDKLDEFELEDDATQEDEDELIKWLKLFVPPADSDYADLLKDIEALVT